MSPFNAKPLATLTVGEQLAQARRKRGWSAAELARAAGVNPRFLAAFEDDRHAGIPGDVYVRQWLRQLSNQLQLDGSALVTQWLNERKRVAGSGQTDAGTPAARTITTRQIRWTAAGAVAVAGLSFIGVRLYAVVAPPPLAVTSPVAGTTALGDVFSIDVSGTTAPEASVTVNGQVVTTAVGGSFSVTVPLHRGVNAITVSSRTKHSFGAAVKRVVTVGNQP